MRSSPRTCAFLDTSTMFNDDHKAATYVQTRPNLSKHTDFDKNTQDRWLDIATMAEEIVCKNFWRGLFSSVDGMKFKELHPHLRGKTLAQLAHSIPMRLHEDSGPFTKTKSVDVVSTSSVLGRGTELQTKYASHRLSTSCTTICLCCFYPNYLKHNFETAVSSAGPHTHAHTHLHSYTLCLLDGMS